MKLANQTFLLMLILFASLQFAACGNGGDTEDGDAETDTDLQQDGDDDIEADAEAEVVEEEQADGDPDIEEDLDEDLEIEIDEDNVDDDPELETEEIEEEADTVDGDPDVDPEPEIEPEEEIEEEVDGDLEEEWDFDFGHEVEEEVEEELICDINDVLTNMADFNSLGNQSTAGEENSIQSDCFLWDMVGKDVMYEIHIDPGEIYELTVTPTDNVDIAVYITNSCEIDAACLFSEDSNGAGQAEVLTFEVTSPDTYYVVIDSRESNSETAFSTSVEVFYPGFMSPTEVCEQDWECSSSMGAGLCVGNNGVKACTISCNSNEDCTSQGFNSGCCLDVGSLGKYCHLSLDCGTAGQTAAIGEECATDIFPNKPLCDAYSNATMCLDNTAAITSYCTTNCTVDNDCTELTGGSCVDIGETFNICVGEEDSAKECTGSDGIVLVQQNQLPKQFNAFLSGQKNSVNAFGCNPTGTPGRDFIYQIYLTSGQSIYANLSGITNFDAALQVVTQCGWTDTSESCLQFVNDNGPNMGEELLFTAEYDGYFNFVVDSMEYGFGSNYVLDLELIEPEIEEEDGDDEIEEEQQIVSCSADFTIARENLPYNVTDLTYNMFDDVNINIGCGAIPTPGEDIVYAVSLEAGDTLYADLTANSSWDPLITIYSPCQSDSCLQMEDSNGLAVGENLEFNVLTSGQYFVVIDSKNPGFGHYELTLSLDQVDGDLDLEEEIETQNCDISYVIGDYSNIIPYTNNTETTFTNNKASATTADASCFGYGTPGADHIYQLDLQAGEAIDVYLYGVGTIVQDAEFDVAVYISSMCEGNVQCLASSDVNPAGGDEFIQNFVAPATATYYIVVDSPFAAQTGYYDILVDQGGNVDGDVELEK